MTELSVAGLVSAAQGGDQHAFTRLVELHRDQLWAVCRGITNHHHDAEDALQDCLIAAWHHLGSFRGEAKIGTWLYRIAANAALAVAKRRQRVTLDNELEVVAGQDVGRQVTDVLAVRQAIAALPEAFRQTIVLREICDLSYDEIAAAQQISVQTVKSRLHRARGQIEANLRQG